MKRVLATVFAALLVFGVAGTASASFYAVGVGSDYEIATGLGDGQTNARVDDWFTLSDLISTPADQLYANVDVIGVNAWSTVETVPFGRGTKDIVRNHAYVAVEQGVTPQPATNAAIATAFDGAVSYHGGTEIKPTNGTGFDIKFSPLAEMGAFFNNADFAMDLSALDAAGDQSVTFDIWYAEWNFDDSTKFALDTIATFTVGEDNGAVFAEVNAVPVPAAVWLLGSGLLGLIGIRRRNA